MENINLKLIHLILKFNNLDIKSLELGDLKSNNSNVKFEKLEYEIMQIRNDLNP